VSYYTGAYEIHQFLLGHAELLVWVLPFDNQLLVSASADSTIKLWSMETGECLSTLSTPNLISNSVCYASNDSLWVAYEGTPTVDLIKINNNALIKEDSVDLGSTPYAISSLHGHLIALVSDKPHIRNPDNAYTPAITTLNSKVSLVAPESHGKSDLRKAKRVKLE
jgi:WD40 repeat protein